MDKLMTILKEIRPDVDFEKEEKLIDGGILDSFDIIGIIAEINDSFDIEISVDDLIPENFNSIYAIKNLIDKLLNNK